MIKVSFAAGAPRRRLCARHSGPQRGHARRPARRPRRAGRALAARAAEAQRFEREAGAIAETFVDEGDAARRLLLVGLGGRRRRTTPCYERVGGALTARLLTSGETRLVVDLDRPRPRRARRPPGSRFGAAARSWRYDLYRTKLGRKQKPTLEEVVIVGARRRRRARHGRTRRPCSTGLDLTRDAGHRAGQHHLSRELRRALPRGARAARRRVRGARREGRWRSSAWAPCSASPRARSGRRGCW